MAEENINVNHSLDRRRSEQLLQEGVGRLGELAADGLGIWQKVFAFNAGIAHAWGDTFNSAQSLMDQVIVSTKKDLDRVGRAS